MKIDIAKGDLHTLRSCLYEEFWRLANTPAATSKEFRPAVDAQLRILRKVGNKLNMAIAKVYGRGCYMEEFSEERCRGEENTQ